ncbi:MAG: transposase [Thermoanaerobaculia bacterium]
MRHLAHKVPAFWRIFVGIYAATCVCAKFFTSTVEGVALRAGYTDAVRQKVVDLLIRDHLPLRKVQTHLKEDFALEVSVGFIYDCLNGAEAKIDKAAYWEWVLKNFSGVMCVDEVHDCGRTILVATDPLNDVTVDFKINEKNDQPSMNAFLDSLKNRGLRVLVAVTDGSALYKKALGERWKGLQHQLCVFHFLKDQMDEVLAAIRKIRDELPVNPPHRRGRPSGHGRPRKDRHWRQKLLNENIYLLVKKKLTREERLTLTEIYALDERFRAIRRYVDQLHRVFAKGLTQQAARNRRTRLLGDRRLKSHAFLAKPLQMLGDDAVFEKLIVSLGWHHVDRTSNHVERKNRSFRKTQKTCYKRRTTRTIEQAYWLRIDREFQNHPLNTEPGARALRIRKRSARRRRRALAARGRSPVARHHATPLRRPA